MYLRIAKLLILQIIRKMGSANGKCKVSHLRKVYESNKLFKFANLPFCALRNLFVDRPPLHFIHRK